MSQLLFMRHSLAKLLKIFHKQLFLLPCSKWNNGFQRNLHHESTMGKGHADVTETWELGRLYWVIFT